MNTVIYIYIQYILVLGGGEGEELGSRYSIDIG